MKIIKLTKGLFSVVDDADYDRVNAYKWHVNHTGNGTRFYASRSIWKEGNRRIYMHRFITSCPDGQEVNHINGNTLDNRRSNLEIVDKKTNLHKRKFVRSEERRVG